MHRPHLSLTSTGSGSMRTMRGWRATPMSRLPYWRRASRPLDRPALRDDKHAPGDAAAPSIAACRLPIRTRRRSCSTTRHSSCSLRSCCPRIRPTRVSTRRPASSFPSPTLPEALLELGEDGVKPYLKTVGLYNTKTKNLDRALPAAHRASTAAKCPRTARPSRRYQAWVARRPASFSTWCLARSKSPSTRTSSAWRIGPDWRPAKRRAPSKTRSCATRRMSSRRTRITGCCYTGAMFVPPGCRHARTASSRTCANTRIRRQHQR